MNSAAQASLIKGVLSRTSLNFSQGVLSRQLQRIATLTQDRKKELESIEQDELEFKFYSRQISFEEYCKIRVNISKEVAELVTKNHMLIGKNNLLQLCKMKKKETQPKFGYMLLQKFSENIGDMNVQEILECLSNLYFSSSKIQKFQFDLLAERLFELMHVITTDQLVQILFLCGKHDAPSDTLWNNLTSLFLFRLNDLNIEQVLQVAKGFAASQRGNQLVMSSLCGYFEKNCKDIQNNEYAFDFAWILMKSSPEDKKFWELINKNYTYFLSISKKHSPVKFLTFFKYSIQNIFFIAKVNQGELFTLLFEIRQELNQNQINKVLLILANKNLLTQQISNSLTPTLSNLPLPNKSDTHF